MSLSNLTNRLAYTGNGVTTAFPVSFPFNAQADLVVVETIIATGVQTTKALTTDYTISGTPDAYGHYVNGGTVNAVSAPPSTVTWTIYRDPALTQAVTHIENDPLPIISGVEHPDDKLTMIAQRTRELVTRTLRQPDGDSAAMSVMPAKVARASKYLAFNSIGDPIASESPALSPNGWVHSSIIFDSDYATLNDAITAVGSSLITLIILDTFPVTANVTSPENLTLMPLGAGKISVNSSVTLTIDGPISAPLTKHIFTGSGTVLITKRSSAYVSIGWTGAIGDDSTDNTAAIDRAVEIAKAANIDALIPNGVFRMTTGSLKLDQQSYVGVRGLGWGSVLKNVNSSNTPTILLDGQQYFTLKDFAIIGVSTNPNKAIKAQEDGSANRTAFGRISNILLQPDGIGIHLTDTNTVGIEKVAWWPSGASWLGASATGSNLTNFILADGVGAIADIHITQCNALARLNTAGGGATIKWNTTDISSGVTIRDSELEEAVASSTALSLHNLHNFEINGNFFENADITITKSRYGWISGNEGGANHVLTIGDGTADNLCLRVIAANMVGGTFTADANNLSVGAINSTFQTAYTNNAVDPITINVAGAGGVTIDDQPRITLTAVPFDAGDFTASGSMTWTVAAGDVAYFRYSIIGKLMTVFLRVNTSTVGGTPSTALSVKIPGGKTAATGSRTVVPIHVIDDNTGKIGVVDISGTSMDCYMSGTQTGNWAAATDTTYVTLAVSFPIN
jgi:hypothetical protein